jgi:thymidylate synthase ThyX
MDFKVEILKYPTEEDWMWAKTCCLNTIGKTSAKLPTEEWKKDLIRSEHSPIRELKFGIKLTIPSYCSVHFVRHKFGVEHYVSTQRDDRNKSRDVSRADMPQGTMVTHIISVNAQELMFMARRRLCTQADEFTRKVMEEICRQVVKVSPEFDGVFGPMCHYRGGVCTEFECCGRNKMYKGGGNNE